MTLSYIHAKLAYLILEYRTISDDTVYLNRIFGGGYNEVIFGANKPLGSAYSMQFIFQENDQDAAQKLKMIEQFFKKEITFDQLFNN